MIVIPQPVLKNGLAIVGRAVAGKSTLPSLSHVQIEADPLAGLVRLAATDLRIGLLAWLGVRIDQAAAVCLPWQLVSDVVGALPDDEIRISVDEPRASATFASGPIDRHGSQHESTFKGLGHDEFPVIPDYGGQALLALRSDALSEALNAVTYAAATDDSRPVLAGVHLAIMRDRVQFTTADGFRAARYVILLDQVIDVETTIDLIPEAAALAHLAAILDSTKEPTDVLIRISPNGGQVSFDVSGAAGLSRIVLIARLIEGKFPDMDRLIPSRYDRRVLVERAAMRRAVKLAGYFAVESARIVKLDTVDGGDTGPGQVVISANAAEVGNNRASVDAMVHGPAGKIALNVVFLAETLTALRCAQFAIETRDENNPAVVKPVGGGDRELHILMPMSVR